MTNEPRPGELGPYSTIHYLDRSRAYYLAQGYDNPYQWAHHRDVPFTKLSKPLAESRIGIVTTASPFQPELADQGPRAAYNAEAKFHAVYSDSTATVPDLRISHIGYDRVHTVADDINSYFPLTRLREAEAAGRIAEVAGRFHGLPTTRSQRSTNEQDAPELLKRLREDRVDAAVMVPV